MARLVSMALFIFIVFSFLLMVFVPDTKVAYITIGMLALAFTLFVFTINKGAKRMQKELRTINSYLQDLEKIEKIEYKTRFFTQEFDDINQNLIKVLKSSKKREDTKQRYNTKLKLKNRQRADMISAIAHEFRNPIASIMGYSQTLQDDAEIPTLLREKFLEKIYNNGNKIEALLARLILWNKFESGETTLDPTKFDLYILVEENRSCLEDKYHERKIIIEGSKTIVNADRTLIEIVLKNLIENALKYSKDEITIRIMDSSVFVSDKGMGISSSDITKVTKKFYRSSTHNWDNSMGLGLSIVKNILALHGSKLDIESKLDVGSTFSFKL